MQQIFNALIKQDIKPFLIKRGYKKKGLNFYRTTENLIYLINFQKSSGNTADTMMFYVNCGIYAAELARLQSREMVTAPKEAECHFRARINSIVEDAPDRFSITATTNLDEITKLLLLGLEEVHNFYETMTSARSIVDYYIAGPFCTWAKKVFICYYKPMM